MKERRLRRRQQSEPIVMMMKKSRLSYVLTIILLLIPVVVFAQDAPVLELRLSRDNGFGLGNQMQGNFSYRVSGPETLIRVEYLMDGEIIGESTEEPFRFRFVTDDYELGLHEMSAVGYTADGQVLESNVIRGDFVDPQLSNTFTYGIIGLVLIVIVARFLFFRNTSGQTNRGYGTFGGAVCSNCDRPFARHWWSINMLATRIDRCPHCGKWQGARRATAEQLAVAEAYEASLSGAPVPAESEMDEQESLRKQLDDSRYEDI